jgi:hypothetical protein
MIKSNVSRGFVKKVIGWTVIAFLAAVDFAMVQSLILESNAAAFVAILGAVLFCVGFEGGPAFLGMGLVELFDKTRAASGTGRTKSIVYIVVGSICTAITFIGYFVIRRDAIVVAGGFNGMRYEGYYGDLILLIVPFITSLTAFGLALWFSSNGVDYASAEVREAQKEYEVALSEKNKADGVYKNMITTLWARHFPDEKMPTDHIEAISKIRGKLSGDMGRRMSILLPQIICENNLITPFTNSFKEIFKTHVQDSDYLSVVSIPNFDLESRIGEEYARLKKRIDYAISSIIGVI